MKTLEWKSLSLLASLSLAMMGCYSSAPYTPYGYPNPYAVPPGTTMPNGSYMIPQQGYPATSPSGATLGPPTTFAPGMLPQTASPTVANPAWQNNAGPSEATPADTNNKVPEYRDLDDDQTNLRSFNNGPSLVSAEIPETFDPDPFAQPIERVANSVSSAANENRASSQTIVTTSAEEVTTTVSEYDPAIENQELSRNHFGHDENNYRWLRGVLDYDDQDKTWNIIYDLEPKVDDQFGGSLVLANNPTLAQLKTGEVVQISGFLDENETDRFGKPLYQIDKLTRIPTK